MMKGVILCGGTGSRMMPLTKSVNKHLLPIGKKPMLQHSVEKLVEAGITDIMVVTGGEHLGGLAEFLGSGHEFGCDVTYRVQDRAGGIAEALGLARGFTQTGDSLCVVLGDNMFSFTLKHMVAEYEANSIAAMILLSEVEDPERFGVAEVGDYEDGEFEVLSIEEKPEHPKSNYAVIGVYFYDAKQVFEIIDGLEPSARDELEITDVNNAFLESDCLTGFVLPGWWTDAGTHESYAKANELMRRMEDGHD